MDIIVWAVDDFNAMALMRQLGQDSSCNILFLIIGNKRYAYKSKYCHKYIETNNIQDGFEYLKKTYKDKKNKPVLFTSGDNVMVFLDNHRNEIESYIYLPGCSKERDTEFYTDKFNMWSVAKEVGMDIPNCHLVSKKDRKNLDGIQFPCLIKPSHETPGLYNEFKFKVCKNAKKLSKTLKYVRETSTFVVQDYIQSEHQLLVYGCRTPQKQVVIAGSMLVDRYSETGSSSYGVIQNDTFGLLDTELVKKFLDRIDYVGLFSFEFGVSNNKPYFFEINLRNDGTSNLFFQSGANIPLFLAYSFLEKDCSGINTTSAKGIAIDDLYDYENVLKKRIKKEQWNEELQKSSYFKYYDKNDLEPYYEAKKGSKKQMRRDILLKKYRLFIVYIFSKMGLKK